MPAVLAVAALVLLWWLVSATGLTSGATLPTPGKVFSTVAYLAQHDYGPTTLWGHVAITSGRILGGFGLGLAAGITLALLLRTVRPLHVIVDPIFSFIRPIPAFAFASLLLITLGIGETAKVALIFLAVFPSIAIYTEAAMSALPRDLEEAARMLGASRWRLFWAVRVPAALPDILLGARVMLAVAWTAMMGAELVAANSGIGWMIWDALKHNRNDIVFAGVVIIAITAALMDLVIVTLTNLLTGGWRDRVRGSI